MTVPGWASRLGCAGADPELIALAVACAAVPGMRPERLQRVLAARLENGGTTDARSVLAELGRLPGPLDPEAASAGSKAALALLAVQATVAVVGQPGYPAQLATAWPELGAPAWLFVRAPAGLPAGPAVAVVGTRHATLDGLQTARALGRFLARRGICVVSGLARGIDQAAHTGALDVDGPTIGVLGTGFGVDYPRRDGAVRAAVAAAGGLVTELLPGAPPRPAHFLARNRIISGLADAVVVVEGQARSGALQTARLAAAQGREAFAVPGSLNLPTSRGPLDLVRDGARVLTRFEDLLEVLPVPDAGPAGARSSPAEATGLPVAARKLLRLLGSAPAAAGVLADAAGLPLPATLGALAELESRGLATLTGRGFVASGGR